MWGVVAALVATVGPTPAAHAAELPGPAPWQGPVEVATERGEQFSSVGAALDADGRGIVVWASRAPRYAITAVDVAPDGAVGPPVTLSGPDDRASAPLVGMSAEGEAIVAWHSGPQSRAVSLCIRPVGGGPCAVQRVSLPGRRAILQSLVVDVDGSAIVAWVQQTMRGWRAAVAERLPGAFFGRARLVGPLGATAADVALGPAGATLVFSRTTAPRSVPPAVGRAGRAARAGRAGRAARAGGAGRVGRAGGAGRAGRVGGAGRAGGTGRAGARRTRGSEVRVASWLRGEPPPVRTDVASPRGHVAVTPRVAVDDRENAVVAWQRMYGRNDFAIAYARIRDCARVGCSNGPGALARLGPLRRLGPRVVRGGPQASTADLTVSGTGERLVIGWIHLPGDERSGSQIRVAQWSGGTLGAPVRVSEPGFSGFDPQVVARGERTVVIFREYGRPGVRDGLVVARLAGGGSLAFAPLAGLSNPALIQQSITRPRLALSVSGVALAVFTDYGGDGSGAGEVSLARLAPGSG